MAPARKSKLIYMVMVWVCFLPVLAVQGAQVVDPTARARRDLVANWAAGDKRFRAIHSRHAMTSCHSGPATDAQGRLINIWNLKPHRPSLIQKQGIVVFHQTRSGVLSCWDDYQEIYMKEYNWQLTQRLTKGKI